MTSASSDFRGASPQDVRLIECDQNHSSRWDAFVRQHGGTYCHLYAWRTVFERVYRLKTFYLAFESGSEWLALLPVAIMPHLPGKVRRAISLPYCNYGGMVSKFSPSAPHLRALAFAFLRRQGIRAVELREIASVPADSEEVTMRILLPECSEQLWRELGDKVRNQVRKAQRLGLTVQWGQEQAASLHEIYARKMGELGTPVHSPRFIHEILRLLGPMADIATVRHHGQAIAAMLVIKFGDTWIDPLAASLTPFKMMNPNMLLYWEALRAACESQVRCFDFGRSQRGSGTYKFKAQWGAEEVELNYQSFLDGEPVSSTAAVFYRSKRASRLSGIWKILPCQVQLKLGPAVRRWLP